MKLRPFVVLPTLLFLLFVSLVLLANSLIQKPSVQKVFLDRLSGLTGCEISLDEIELYLWKGLGIRVYNFEAHQRDGFGRIRASEAIVFVDALNFLRGRVIPKRLHVERPIIDLERSEESEREEDKFEERFLSLLIVPGLDSLTMEKGSLFIRHFPIRFVNLSLIMKKAQAGTLNVKSQGEARLRRESTSFRLQGEITLDQEKEKRPSVDFSFETRNMPLRWIPFPDEVHVINGLCDAQLRIESKSREAATVSGKILVDSPRFSVREKGRSKDYSINSMTFDFRSFVEREKLHVPYLDFKTPDARFSVNLQLDLREKENPYLRLEAESLLMTYSTAETLFPAPLVASWVERDLFPLLRSGDVLVESFLIDGRVLQLKKLELPENQGALAMAFDCKNFTVHGDRHREPLREVSAKVTLKDGELRVSALKGVSGKSEIQEGLLKVQGIFRPNPVLEPWVRGSFDLEELLHQAKADFLPARFKEAIENLESASGILEGQVVFKYEASMDAPAITKAELLLKDGAFKQKNWPFSLLLEQGRLKIGEENRFQGSGSWGTSSFEGEGAFLLKGLSVDPQWLEGVARLDLGQLFPVISPAGNSPEFKGSALCQGVVRKDANLYSFKGTADIGAVTVDHELLAMHPPDKANRISFDFQVIPAERIRFKRILWETGRSRLDLSGDYPLSPDNDINVQCSIPTLSLEDLGLELKQRGFVAQGALEGTLRVNAREKDLSTARVSGEIKGERLSFALPPLPSPIRNCEFEALFSDQEIVIPSFSLMTGESALKGKGELKGWKGLKGALAVTSSPLNISDFVSPGKERGERKERSSFVDHTDIRVSLDARPAQWRGIDSEGVKADFQFSKGAFHILNSQIQIDRGSLEVKGYVKDDAMAFSGHAEFKDQPMESLLKRFGIDAVYEGSLTLEAQLYTEGKELRELIIHLDGGTNILIEKGTIRKNNVLLEILEFLSLQNIFTKRPPDLSKEGLYFESLGGHGKLEQGVLRTENAQMKSPILNAVATGSADLGQGLADFDLGVQPLGTIDAVVSNIPILGHILTGDNRSLITYFFEVKGPILNPQVEHVPFKTLGSGVTGILKRLLLSPVKLFEDISNGIKKLPAPENDGEKPAEHSGH